MAISTDSPVLPRLQNGLATFGPPILLRCDAVRIKLEGVQESIRKELRLAHVFCSMLIITTMKYLLQALF